MCLELRKLFTTFTIQTKTLTQMKKLLLILISLVFTNSVFGQDRVNRPKLSWDGGSEILSTSVGWAYNETLGEWVDYQNLISKDKSYKQYKTLQGSHHMSDSKFTFNTLQIKTLTFNGTKYYVLIMDRWRGRYKYPTIFEDWIKFRSIDCYIFSESEYLKLKNYEKVSFITEISFYLEFEAYDEVKLLDHIQTSLSNETNLSESKYWNYYMFITQTDKGQIRFLTPNRYFSFDSYDKIDFEKTYFETSRINFDKLIVK